MLRGGERSEEDQNGSSSSCRPVGRSRRRPWRLGARAPAVRRSSKPKSEPPPCPARNRPLLPPTRSSHEERWYHDVLPDDLGGVASWALRSCHVRVCNETSGNSRPILRMLGDLAQALAEDDDGGATPCDPCARRRLVAPGIRRRKPEIGDRRPSGCAGISGSAPRLPTRMTLLDACLP